MPLCLKGARRTYTVTNTKVIVFIFNLKNGTFQSLVWYKLSYDSAKKITPYITGTAPAKSTGDSRIASNQAQPGWPGLIMQLKKYLSSLHYVQWTY